MKTRTFLRAIPVASAVALSTALNAQTVTYDLIAPSDFDQQTCLAPCLCPGLHEQGPLVGSFDLTYLHSDPLFDYYRIDRLHFFADVVHTQYAVVGEGLYTIGGEFALTNRLQLTATVEHEGPYRFDSGFFPVAAAFPNISIYTVAHPLCKQVTLGIVAQPSPKNCYADCNRSTGQGVLDIFDFLCFQHAFVSQRPYACDCDTSTGHSTCDIFDFLCFQDAFVAGCP
jgi:hypothetical protein